MGTTADTKSTLASFDRANSQLQNIFQPSHHIICAFLPMMNKSQHAVFIKVCTGRGDPLFHMMASLLGKCCPQSPSFSGPHRSKSEGTRSTLYGECDSTVQPRLAMCSVVLKLVWVLVFLYCKKRVVIFSGLQRKFKSSA